MVDSALLHRITSFLISRARDGDAKTRASDRFVPLHPILVEELHAWHAQTPYGKPQNFVFPSFQKDGTVPVWASIFVQDHLKPAAAILIFVACGLTFAATAASASASDPGIPDQKRLQPNAPRTIIVSETGNAACGPPRFAPIDPDSAFPIRRRLRMSSPVTLWIKGV